MGHAFATANFSPSAGGSFSPIILSPMLWLDPSNAGSVTIATGISQINDLSGNGRNFTQATAGRQPPYATGGSGINGLGCIQGTGVSLQGLSCVTTMATIIGAATNAELTVVAKLSADATADPFGISWSSADTGSYFEFSDSHTYSGFCASVRNAGNAVSAGVMTSPFVWNVQSAAGAFTINVNWAQNFTTATNTFTSGAVTPVLLNASATSMVGLVGELLVTPVLSAGQRTNLRSYLTAKWGTP